jgi:hypothetical protein
VGDAKTMCALGGWASFETGREGDAREAGRRRTRD